MPINRREFMAAPALALQPPAAGFPREQPDRALIPLPADGQTLAVNPPGFGWWRARGAASYRLTADGPTKYTVDGLKDPVHLPPRTLAPGSYTWDVEAVDAQGRSFARRGAWRFTMPAGVPELPWQEPAALLKRMPAAHPRYMFLGAELPQVRATLQTTRRAAYAELLQNAGRALQVPFPEPPRYHTFDGQVRQRMGYATYFGEFRRRVDSVLSSLSLAFLLSGEEKYGLRAKALLLEIGSWDIDGPMSLLSPFGDEPGLSLAKHGQRAYDWLYPLFDAQERERAREITRQRGAQILARLKKADYLAQPTESHNGRLIAYLAEYAVVLGAEAPETAEWLDYALRGLTTFYPHWGDADGGWAEGISYALAYNAIYLGGVEALRAACGFDLFQRPFFRNVRRFFLYATSPAGEMRPFGDGAESGRMGGGAPLLIHHARRFNDPACQWWAEQTGEPGFDPLLSLLTEDTVKAAPPANMPQAAVFRGIGWAALHSALDKPKEDTFLLFKSSPYGSVSHSHADQNSFAIMKGGRALAIPSGHYGPSYSMPHHAQWTRQTKANNCVLVNGEGQVVRSPQAQGRIVAFRHQQALSYACGDAAAAYGGKLRKFLRHVVMLRPGVIVMLDELEAPAPAEFSWLLHAFEEMKLDEAAQTITSLRGGASLTVKLHCAGGLRFSQTEQFETPFNAGNPPEYQKQMPNHWHFTARTARAARVLVAAAMVVRGPGETLDTEWIVEAGRLGVRTANGEAWVRTLAGLGPLAGARAGAETLAVHA